MARVLKERLLAEIGPVLQEVPQFVYIPGKSIDQAIARVASHCHRVRSRLKEGMSTVHTKRQKLPKGQSRGGAQLSIDLSQAFDLLPRDVMRTALLHCGASANLTDLILYLHCKSRYHISHGKQQACIEMRRGVRQGCTLAPVLFSAFTAYYLHLLEERTSKQWVLSSATLFADDTHLAWDIESAHDLNQMQRMVQITFALFAELGMKVNPDKSTLILGLRGRSLKKWVKKRLFHRQKTRYVNLGTPNEQLQIPIQDKMVYLGVIMSYQQFELQTLQHRMRVAIMQKHRLVKVLHSARMISLKHRIRIYLACVRSTTMYGLHAVGVGQKVAARLCSFENRHLRAISRTPVHITRESTPQLFARLGITPTLEYLARFLSRRIPKVDSQTAIWFTQKLEELHACSVPASASTAPPSRNAILPVRSDCKQEACPTCGLYFADLSSMRKHHAKKHGVSLVNSAVKSSKDRAALDLAPHMVDGMPICPHCLKVFPRPQGLREHIMAHCPVLHGSLAPGSLQQSDPSPVTTLGTALGHTCRESLTTPVIRRSSVRQALAGSTWRVLLRQNDLLTELKSFCVICGQWVSEGAGMKTHIRRCHPHAWKHKDSAVARASQAGFLKGSPCHYCSLVVKQAGQHLKHCVVLFQAALADMRSWESP